MNLVFLVVILIIFLYTMNFQLIKNFDKDWLFSIIDGGRL